MMHAHGGEQYSGGRRIPTQVSLGAPPFHSKIQGCQTQGNLSPAHQFQSWERPGTKVVCVCVASFDRVCH